MKHVLIYCRSGFEKECAGEIQDKANDLELFGFPRVKKQTGYVVFECYQEGDADKLIKQIDFKTLIFARQMMAVSAEISDLPSEDRISPILASIESQENFPTCGDIRVETPDTNEAKELLKFWKEYHQKMIKKGENNMATAIGVSKPKLLQNFVIQLNLA